MKKSLFAIAAVLLAALMLSSCVVFPPSIPAQNTPDLGVSTPLPTADAVEAAASPTETPLPPAIEYAGIDHAAVKKFMQIKVGGSLDEALAVLGQPEAVYGENGYGYRAVAGSENEQPALVYRFLIDGVPLELIAGADDGLVLKKQVSTPDVFPKLLDTASTAQIDDGTPYADVLKQLGKNPYLWMEFTLPNPTQESGKYQVAIWPDANGQFAAVIKDAVVLRSEYQPRGILLAAAPIDGETPRVPRYLEPLPNNANSKVTGNSYFKKFASLKINAPEQAVTAAFGEPGAVDETDASLRVLNYAFISADFALVRFVFTFSLTEEGDSLLMAKKAALMPVGATEVLARYAPQMLSGMKKADVEKFMGKGFWADLAADFTGQTVASYMWAGEKACVSALFVQGGEIVLGNDKSVNDTPEEAASLYEEYVIVLSKGTPKPRPTPVQTRRPSDGTPPAATTTPEATRSPLPSDKPSRTKSPLVRITPSPTPRPGKTYVIPSLPPRITIVP